CWVCDFLAWALPQRMERAGDQAQTLAKAQTVCNEFVAAVRKQLEAKDGNVEWFAPGQRLVVGDEATHAKAAAFFAELGDPKSAANSPLHKLARARLTDREKSRAESVAREKH